MSSSLALVSPSSMATRIINPQIATSISKPYNLATLVSTNSKRRRSLITCKATPPSSSSLITEFDLYELLGIDSSSGQPEIKKAYRSMQKRCHPDIAGLVGHDMAIILNEAYALLSDPISRHAYDKEQAKMAEMRGYTGRPMYSTWLGSQNEKRAVFVDEVKCVGCLKCALFASNTFAIESVYGRARVVAQWADPEAVIQESIDACPVNCISSVFFLDYNSMVERSDLPALEFMMSKQPRGCVRIGVGNTVGVRVSDVFNEAEAFRRRLETKNKKTSPSTHYTGSDSERNRTMSAVQAILAISSWLYQRPLDGSTPTREALTRLGLTSPQPQIDKLKMAAFARKNGKSRQISSSKPTHLYGDEYWAPSTLVLPSGAPDTPSSSSPTSPSSTYTGPKRNYKNMQTSTKDDRKWPLVWRIPGGTAAIGAITVGLQGGRVGGLTEHVAGPLVLQLVNSFWLQVTLAGATWYIAGLMIVRTIEALGRYNTDQND